MRLAQTREQFADDQHVVAQAEMSVGAQALQVKEARPRPLDPLSHELVGHAAVARMLEDLCMRLAHGVAHLGQRVEPAVIVVIVGKACVDTRRAGFLMLQQLVGDAAEGGYHEHAVIEPRALPVADEERVQKLADAAHGCAADLLDGMLWKCHILLSGARGPRTFLSCLPARRSRLPGALPCRSPAD